MGTMVQRMPGRRAFALAIHGVGGTAAEVVAPLGVGFLLAFLDWRQVLQVNTLPALVMGLMFFRISRMVGPSGQASPSRSEVGHLVRTLVQPATAVMLLIMALHNMSLIALMSMAPLYLEEARQFSSVLTGVAFAAFVVAGAVAAPVIGRISDRAGRKRVALLGLFGGGVCTWLVTVAPGAPGVFFFLMATGALSLSVRVVLMAMALEIVGSREATVLGFISAIGEGLGAIGAAAAGIAAERSLATALVFSAALSLASGLVAVLHPFTPAKVRSEAA
jgi:predicted MFS family arabinose efflux permease